VSAKKGVRTKKSLIQRFTNIVIAYDRFPSF